MRYLSHLPKLALHRPRNAICSGKVPELNSTAETSDLAVAVLTIWLLVLILGGPPLFILATFSKSGTLSPQQQMVQAILWVYVALLLIAFFLRRRYPKLIWLPALAVAALVLGSRLN